MNHLKHLFASALVVTLLSACGGDDSGSSSGPVGPTYTGLTTPAAITEANAPSLSTKATDAAEEAIAQDTAQQTNPFGVAISSANSEINPLIVSITRQIASHTTTNVSLPAGVTISYLDLGPGFCGGTVTVPDNFGANNMLNGTVTYNNICYNDGGLYGQILINGTVTFSETASTFTIRYINFTITGTGLSETINMTVTCDTAMSSCSISADFVGSDGKTYRIANMTVTGTGTGPYSISATFYHPDHGYVTLSSNGLMYTCSNGYPGAGSITINGASGSVASVTFTSCDGYSGTWNDGNSSGTFIGTWL